MISVSSCAFFSELMNPSDISAPLTEPSVTILSPTNGEIVEYYYDFTVKATGVAAEVNDVFALLDGSAIGRMKFDESNWTIGATIDDSNSIHTFSAYAIDKKGNVSATNSVTVNHIVVLLEKISLAEDEIMIAYDFSGTYQPSEWGVIPFLNGWNISEYIDGAHDNDYYYLGITQYGDGPQVLKRYAGTDLYYIILKIPDNSDREVDYRVDNYNTAGWDDLENHGQQLTEHEWVRLHINNKLIVENSLYIGDRNFHTVNTGIEENGAIISVCRRRILINVGAHFGWSLHLVGGTMEPMNIMIIITNVPNYMYPYKVRVSNLITNLDASRWDVWTHSFTNYVTHEFWADAYPVIVGDKPYLYTNDYLDGYWDTTRGTPMAYNSISNMLFLVISNLPSGYERGIKFKAVNTLGWDCGDMDGDRFIGLPTHSTNTVVRVFGW
jgi:hypothetical protein